MNIPSLPAIALKRPVSVVMISLSVLILGAIAWYRMPLKFLPEIDQPFVGLSIPYPGASPRQVEEEVAIPVEGELRTIPGLRNIRTISNDSGCFVSMMFSLDTDITVATSEVRDRIERLKLILPENVDRLMIQRFSSRSIPVYAFGFFKEGDQKQFANDVRTIAVPQIQRLEGVANVEILSPIRESEVLIEFDQDTLRAMNLSLPDVLAGLRESSFNLAAGSLKQGERKFYLRVEGEYRRLDEIRDLVVGSGGLRLRDIAEVNFKSRDTNASVTLDGKGGCVVMITKESEANTVDTCDNVKAALPGLLELPVFEGAEQRLFFDQSDLIRSALDNLLKEGLYGAAMALATLFIFLHRFRPTVVVALAIPTSLLVALVAMFFIDMSLNLVTMVSMIIAVGMLVDNAIVVVENIIRYRSMGYDRFESARRGANEVGLAIFAATATTWVVFVPMYYLDAGQMSVFMSQLGFPLIISLAGSLLIALTVIPLAMSRMKDSKHSNIFERIEHKLGLPKDEHGDIQKSKGFLGKLAQANLIERIVQSYGKVLSLILRQRLAAILGLIGLGFATYYGPWSHIGMRELPKLDTREIVIEVETERNMDYPKLVGLFAQMEAEIDAQREELGIKNVMTFFELGGGVLQLYLYNDKDGDEWLTPEFDTEEVMLILSERLPKRVPGAEFKFTVTETGNQGSGGEGAISLTMRGDDSGVLEEYAERFKQTMRGIPELRDVKTDVQRQQQEIRLEIDEALAIRRNIAPYTVATTVDAALRGTRLPYLKQGSREIPVWAQFREEDRKSKANLDNVAVMSPTGQLVPLHELVSFSKANVAQSIHRYNGKTTVTISALTDNDDISGVSEEIQKAVDNFTMPVGYSIEFGQSIRDLDDSFTQFITSLMMAIILIYLVMSALFESFLYPLSILSSVPLALGGAIWMLFFTGNQLDTVTMIGCILMVGLIVNNGIVIIDHINTQRKTIKDDVEAISTAGMHRFRPVMMTAITTILGLIPLALAKTGGAATFAGLGRALIGGLTAGTILTLFVVPLFYTILDDIQNWLLRFAASFRGEDDSENRAA